MDRGSVVRNDDVCNKEGTKENEGGIPTVVLMTISHDEDGEDEQTREFTNDHRLMMPEPSIGGHMELKTGIYNTITISNLSVIETAGLDSAGKDGEPRVMTSDGTPKTDVTPTSQRDPPPTSEDEEITPKQRL